MIDPKKIKVVIQKYNSAACEELHEWLSEKGLSWRYGVSFQEIDVGRNLNVMRFLKEDVPLGFEYMLFLDDDIYPVEETEPILTELGDLVYCCYPDKNGRVGHFGDGTVISGCLRMSAKMLVQMSLPYFRTRANANLTEQKQCDCAWMADRAIDLQIQPRLVGYCGHLQKVPLFIDPDSNGTRWMMRFRGCKRIKEKENKCQ